MAADRQGWPWMGIGSQAVVQSHKKGEEKLLGRRSSSKQSIRNASCRQDLHMGKLVEYQHILSATIIQVCFRWCEDQVLHKLAKILEIRRLEANRTSLPTPQQLVQFVRQVGMAHSSQTVAKQVPPLSQSILKTWKYKMICFGSL